MKENETEDFNLKGKPFEVPEGYFDSFEDRLQSRIDGEREQSSPLGVLKTALCLAAAFAVVFGIGYGTLRMTGTDDYKDQSAKLSAEAQVSEDCGPDDYFIDEDTAGIDSIEDEEIVTFLTSSLTSSDITYYSELL